MGQTWQHTECVVKEPGGWLTLRKQNTIRKWGLANKLETCPQEHTSHSENPPIKGSPAFQNGTTRSGPNVQRWASEGHFTVKLWHLRWQAINSGADTSETTLKYSGVISPLPSMTDRVAEAYSHSPQCSAVVGISGSSILLSHPFYITGNYSSKAAPCKIIHCHHRFLLIPTEFQLTAGPPGQSHLD